MQNITNWEELIRHVKEHYQLEGTVEELLFFVGMQEYGHGICCYSKDEKLALIKVGLCKVFSYAGLFEFKGYGGDGWPRWEQVQGSVMPAIEKQEELIKTGLISFFRGEQ